MIRRSLGAALWTLVGLLAGFLGALSSLVGTGAGRTLLARVSEGALRQVFTGTAEIGAVAGYPRPGRLERRDRERRPQRTAPRPPLRAPRRPPFRLASVVPARTGNPHRRLPAGRDQLRPRGATRGRGGSAPGGR